MSLHDPVLAALRIKGFAKPDALSDVLGREAGPALADLLAKGMAEETRIGLRLTEAGKTAADALTEWEREALSGLDMDAQYDAFHHLNGPFKQAIADWQMRDGAPNDHADAAYDAGIVARIRDTHIALLPILSALGASVPRLGRYAERFDRALAAIDAGEARMVAAPIIDSYHTVWFELHEDLIRLSGRSRAEEARAGRAV